MVTLGIAFLAAYLIIEFKAKLAETLSVVTFKRGTGQIQTPAPQPGGIEAPAVTTTNLVNDFRSDNAKAEKALVTAGDTHRSRCRGNPVFLCAFPFYVAVRR